jgi:translation initiation factor IF-2
MLILSDDIMKKIDELAGEKQRRSLVVETALREYIVREEKKRPKVVESDEAVIPGRPGAPGRPASVVAAAAKPAPKAAAAKPAAKPAPKPAAKSAAAKPVAAKAITRGKR